MGRSIGRGRRRWYGRSSLERKFLFQRAIPLGVERGVDREVHATADLKVGATDWLLGGRGGF